MGDFKKYEEELSKIGVIVKARNFLVFQGYVTGIASKTGKQLTKWFEQISGSDQYKEEYERARMEQEQVQNEFEGVNERNRNVAKEKKQMKQQKDEASQFRELEENLERMKSESYRFQLYHIQKEVKAAVDGIQSAEEDLAANNENLKELEQEIKLKQADLTKTLRKKTQITFRGGFCMSSGSMGSQLKATAGPPSVKRFKKSTWRPKTGRGKFAKTATLRYRISPMFVPRRKQTN